MERILRPVDVQDREKLVEFFKHIPNFNEEEQKIAMELVDSSLTEREKGDYLTYITCFKKDICGYLCFGPTPMTNGTYDLYWMATHPNYQRQGVARELILFMQQELKKRKARVLRIETASKENYAGTHQFYLKMGFREEARIKNFYDVEDDLVIYTSDLSLKP